MAHGHPRVGSDMIERLDVFKSVIILSKYLDAVWAGCDGDTGMGDRVYHGVFEAKVCT